VREIAQRWRCTGALVQWLQKLFGVGLRDAR